MTGGNANLPAPVAAVSPRRGEGTPGHGTPRATSGRLPPPPPSLLGSTAGPRSADPLAGAPEQGGSRLARDPAAASRATWSSMPMLSASVSTPVE